MPHMILVLISLGLAIRVLKNNNKKLNIIYWILLMFISFINGLGSVKGIMAIYLPMFVGSFILLISKLHFSKDTIKDSLRFIVISFISLIFSGIGYLINTKVLVNIYHVSTDHGRVWSEFNINEFIKSISEFLSLFGSQHPGFWDTKVDIFSINGILGAFLS